MHLHEIGMAVYFCELFRDLSKHFIYCLFCGRRLSFIREKVEIIIVIGVWVSPGVVSGGKAQSFLMIYSHWTAYSGIKNLYSWPKKLYQFITNLFSLANIPTLGQVKYHIGKNLTLSCLRSWLTGVTERYLPLQYCTPTEIHVNKAQKNKSAGTSIILLQYVFSVSE